MYSYEYEDENWYYDDYEEETEKQTQMAKLRKKLKKHKQKVKELEEELEYETTPTAEEEEEYNQRFLEHLNQGEYPDTVSPKGMFYCSSEYSEPQQNSEKESPQKLAVRLTNSVLQTEIIKVADGIVYQYISQQGRYIALSDSTLNYVIMKCISEEDRDRVSRKVLTEIRDRLRCLPELKCSMEDFDKNPMRINCMNGIVEMDPYTDTITVLKHSPDILFTYVVNAEYEELDEDGYRNEANAFEQYCKTSFADDVVAKRNLLLEQMGYAISDSTDGKCMLLGIGSANGGKSLTAKFVSMLFHSDNLCAISLHEIFSEFARARLLGKKLNILAEMSSKKLHGIDVLKSITSGDTISAAFKGKDSFEFPVKTKLWFFANNFPVPADIDPSDGFFNRLVPLIYATSIPPEEQDKNLLKKLWNERNLIVSMAIDAYLVLVQRNYRFRFPKDSRDFLDGYKANMNSVRAFVEDCLVVAPDKKVLTRDIVEKYAEFCINNGLEKMKIAEIHLQLRSVSGVYPCRIAPNNWRGYAGIGLKEAVE